jgi:hypothetical protein
MIMKSQQGLFILIAGLFTIGCGGYKTEGDKVYYIQYNEARGKVKREIGADKETFRVLEIETYAIDAAKVFYQGSPLDSADPASFVPLSDFIGRDKFRGYYGSDAIKGSDGETFEMIDGNYTRDKNDVYYVHTPLHSTSPETFEILTIGNGNWSRDKNSYYYTDNKIPVKDYKSFEILDNDCSFAKDKFQVYKQEQILEGVDAETFKFLEICIGQDKFGCHNGYQRCDCPETKK